jgi:membrane protein required for colicin V production
MRAADWTILVVVLASVIQAAIAGFFQEAFAIGGLVTGYLLAAWQYQRVAHWFAAFLQPPWAESAAFVGIFVLVAVLAGLVGRTARWVVKKAGLTTFDRVLGGALGAVRGCLIVAVLLMAMTAFTPTSKWLEGSALAPYFLVVGRAAIWVAPADLRARFYQGLDLLQRGRQAEQTGAAGSNK